MKHLGIEIPTAIRKLSNHNTHHYIKTPQHSADWGAEWESPTSLDFEMSTIQADDFGIARQMRIPQGLSPDKYLSLLTWEMESGVASIAHFLTRSGRVMDVEGLATYVDQVRDTIRLRGRAWPLVPGVTTTWMDSTR